jgi:hypothetical protein
VQRVVVTVRREDEVDGPDLALPDEVPAAELTDQVTTALGWPAETRALRIRVEPGGRVLEPRESLAQAGVRDGAWLIFAAAPAAPEPAVAGEPDAFPRFLPTKMAPTERPVLPIVAVVLGLAVVAVVLGVWLTRPQAPVAAPAPVATSVPTAAPLPPTPVVVVAAPLVVPTPVPVPTAVPTPMPTLAPTSLPTTVPTVLPTRVPDAASVWPTVLAQLDTAWGQDWPRVIDLSQGFLQRFPGHAAATDKLYVALVEYGRELRAGGQLDAARSTFEGAAGLGTGRLEAITELEAMAQPPVVVQPTVVVAPPPQRPPVAQPEPAPPAEEPAAPPPPKLDVTRDGYLPPDNDP